MIVGDLEIRLRGDIARLQRDMDSARRVVSDTASGISRAADMMKTALASIGIGAGIAEIIRMSDEYTKFTAQLRLAATSQREYAASYESVRRIAKDSQQSLSATGTLYARIANGTRELGTTQKQVAAITETVNLALRVSGATATESASAQLQLSQAFASGTLRGEEFNAVNEAAPRLMLALADGIGVPVGALKKMAEEGAITSKIMSDVLPSALEKLREESKQVSTIGGAFTVLKNELMEFTATKAEANGTVAVLTTGIRLLSENLGLLMGVLTTLGAAKIGVWMATWVTSTYNQIAASNALRAANVALLESELASSSAKIAQLGTTQAMIVVAREEAVAKLAGANANMFAAESAIAAATAAGAQSFALRTLRLATADLAVAEAMRSAMLAELAILGRQQVSVTAQLAAATTAQAAAQSALNATTGAGAVASGLATRALGFLGGPIGAIITVLGLAATAWAVWGRTSKEATTTAAETAAENFASIIKGLDAQIEKHEALIRLRRQGMSLDDAKKVDQKPLNELGALSSQLATLNASKSQGIMNDSIETKRAEVMAKILELTTKINTEQVKGAQAVSLTQDEARREFMKDYATKDEQRLAKLADARKKLGSAFTAEDEARINKAYEERAAGANKEETAYKSLMTSIAEKIAANKLEMAGYDKLTESQKATIKLDAEIGTGKTKLGAESIKSARAQIAVMAGQEDAIKRVAEALEMKSIAEKSAIKNDDEMYAKISKGTTDLDDQIAKMKEQIEVYGLTETAVVDLAMAKAEAALAAGPASYAELVALDAQIEKLKELRALTGKKEALDISKKAADDTRAEWKRTADSIEQSLTDALLRGFESGKSFGKNLIDTLKNMFSTLVLRPIIQGSIQNVMGSGGGGASGMLGQGASLIDMGKSIYSAFSTGITGSLGSMISGLGSTFGSSAVTAFGSGMSMGPAAAAVSAELAGGAAGATTGAAGAASAGAGASAGAYAIPIAGWIAAGMALSNNLLKKGWDADNGSMNGLGSAINASTNRLFQKLGMGKTLSNMLSGASTVSRLFGRKNPEITDQGISGTFNSSGFAGEKYANILEKGGVFRSDKKYSETYSVGDQMDGSFDSTIKNMLATVKGFGDAMGLEVSQIDGYTKQIKLSLGADQAKNDELIAGLFGDIGNDLAKLLIPAIDSLAVSGETSATTLQRVATNYIVIDEALAAVGSSFGAVGIDSLAARERLIELSGGLEAFGKGAAFFAQNFLSESERTEALAKKVSDAFDDLGVSGISTRDEFKKLVLSLDLTTENGAKTYAGLMGMQEAFAALTPALADAADNAKAIREMEIQIMELSGDAAGALAASRKLELDGMDAALRPQKERIYQLTDEAAALALTTKAQEDAIARSNSLLSIQAEIYEITGNKAGAAAVLQKQQAAALAVLDPALRGATEALWGLQAAAKGVQDAKATAAGLVKGVDEAFAVLQRVASAEKERITSAHTLAMANLQEEIDAETKANVVRKAQVSAGIANAKALSDAIRSSLDQARDVGSEGTSRASAQAAVMAALAIARAGGGLPSADSLKGSLSTLAQDSTDLFATMQDYQRDFYRTQNSLKELGALSDSALSIEEKTLKELEEQKSILGDQKDILEQAYKAEVSRLDNILASAQSQIDVLKGIDISNLTIVQALQALNLTLAAARANPVSAAAAPINEAYKNALGRAPDAAGMEYWQNAVAGGQSTATVVSQITNSMEAQIRGLYKDLLGRDADNAGLIYFLNSGSSIGDIGNNLRDSEEYQKKLRGFAVGTNNVPYDMVAQIHEGERIIPAADNRLLMQRLSSPSESNAVLAAAVDRLTAKVSEQQATLDKISSNTGRGADTLERVTDGGVAMRTKEEPA